MKWISTASDNASITEAVAECANKIQEQLGDASIDLCVVFISSHHNANLKEGIDAIKQLITPKCLVGCSAGAVLGSEREIENSPGISITAAILPGVTCTPFHLENENIPPFNSSREQWESALNVLVEDRSIFILLPDPQSFDIENCLQNLDDTFPDSIKVGGIASTVSYGEAASLFLNNNIYQKGMVGLALSGNIECDTIVAQGCRPIGAPMFLTKSKHNILQELDCKSPGEVIRELYASLSDQDQRLFQTSLFIGLVMRPQDHAYGHGDFLIRNILGLDSNTGHLAISALPEENQIVQFHLRDANTSKDDLKKHLRQYKTENPSADHAGGLLFSCLGRGEILYGEPDHDSRVFTEQIGNIPLGGFFCNGEIGPVQDSTYVHGYTSCFVIFRPRYSA